MSIQTTDSAWSIICGFFTTFVNMKAVRIILLILSVDFALSVGAAPAQFSFLKYQIDNGLSHNTVWCTLQDSYGFIWMGTNEGLNRFDGKHYRLFNLHEQGWEVSGSNQILSLFEDKQKQLWIGTSRGIYLYDLQTETFQQFTLHTEDGIPISCEVSNIISDDMGRVWIGTSGQGLFIYNPETNTLIQNSLYAGFVWALYKSPSGNIYMNSHEGNILEFNRAGYHIDTYESPHISNSFRNINITSIYYKDGVLWYGYDVYGLVRTDLRTRETTVFKDDTRLSSYINGIHPYSDRELLIGTENGLYLFDTQRHQYTRIDNYNDPRSLNDQSVNHIYEDREGGLWFSTMHGGVNYLFRNASAFEHYYPFFESDVNMGKVIREMYEDEEGKIWIASEDQGVTIFDPKNKTFTPYKVNTGHVNTILLDNGKAWIGTATRGIDIYDLKTGNHINYQFRNGAPGTLSDNNIRKIYRTRNGDIYIGTAWGINKYNRETADFSSVSQIGNNANVSDILEDKRGFIWFTTSNAGVFRYNPENNGWRHFNYSSNNPGSLPTGKLTTIFEDSNGDLWFGTEGRGICRFNRSNGNSFTLFDTDGELLPSQVIYRIEEDEQHNLWLSSNSGLICVNPLTNEVVGHYTREDGLQSNQFNYSASLKSADGKIYFGGINGFNVFDSRYLQKNTFCSNLLISNFYLSGEQVYAGNSSNILKKSIFETDKLLLSHNQNTFGFDFSNLSYKLPQKKQYAYKLEGFDNRWINLGNNSSVSFNNMSPGQYVLHVKAANESGWWEDTVISLPIQILPPFYKSGLAYIIYLVIIFFVGFMFFRWWTLRVRRKHELLIQEEQIKKEKELYNSKIEFFTNLVHEVRTPLSLIKIPLEYIIKSKDGNEETRNYLSTIEKNTNRLLNLVNQLLDFRKVEESKYELNIGKYDVAAILQEVCSRFIPIARLRNIEFNLNLPQEAVEAHIDREAVTKIISNLLTNALKYTHGKIEVSICAYEEYFEIYVADDGEGVAKGDENKIFDAFYQSDNSKSGTGIGLPLARLLAGKHNGKLYLKHSKTKGATFVLALPFVSLPASVANSGDKLHEETLPEDVALNIPDITHTPTNQQLLLVEDNEDLLALTASFLSKIYKVHTASNGRQALEIIEKENINVIVSDLMMPEMDGYELCEYVKNDSRFSHIPVVILTAKTSLNARIKGLGIGADAYIEKPYSLEHLLVQISNLLENRRKLIEVYSSTHILPANMEISLQKKDKEFIDKLNAEIEKHLQEADFSIDTLVQNMYMSRSNFYRKIKGLFDLSPNDYLRTFRLRKAVELLQKGEYRIGEVYLMVGFNSPSYFTKCFKEQYGVTPKEYLQKLTN